MAIITISIVMTSCEKQDNIVIDDEFRLESMLEEYPEEITTDNYKLFVNAPAEVLTHFSEKEGKITRSNNVPMVIDAETKNEILRSWGGSESTNARMTCDCSYIAGIVPNLSFYPTNWVGGMYADLNFSGNLSAIDLVIMSKIIANYDNNGDNAITGWSETLSGTATYDYDGNGLINSDDNWAAAMFTWQLSDIANQVWSFDSADKDCIVKTILGLIQC